MANHTFQSCDRCHAWIDQQPSGFLVQLVVVPAKPGASADALPPMLQQIAALPIPRVELCADCLASFVKDIPALLPVPEPAPVDAQPVAAATEAPPTPDASSSDAAPQSDTSPAKFSVDTLVEAAARPDAQTSGPDAASPPPVTPIT